VLVAGVLGLVAAAGVDALIGGGNGERGLPEPTAAALATTTGSTANETETTADDDSVVVALRSNRETGTRLDASSGLEGTLFFTRRAKACPLVALDLATARARTIDVPGASGCRFRAPKTGPLMAKSENDALDRSGSVRYRLVDLSTGLTIGRARAWLGEIIWENDGDGVAWCTSGRSGIAVRFNLDRRRLEVCPRVYGPQDFAYVRRGELLYRGSAYAKGIGDARQVMRASDGAYVIRDGRRIQRWVEGAPDGNVTLPRGFETSPISLSPEGCVAAVATVHTIGLIDLGCLDVVTRVVGWTPPRRVFANSIVWSPNGDWLVLAEGDRIAFHRIADNTTVSYPAHAAELAWVN